MGKDVDELIKLPAHLTGFVCTDCGDDITYMDEVFVLDVVQPMKCESGTLYYEVTDEQNPEEGFIFEPYRFCFQCWEKNYEEIRNETQDEPPVLDTYSEHECVLCASGIRDQELAGRFTLGEFHVSARAPNGIRGPCFTPIGNPDLLCLYCLSLLNDGYIDMWPDLSENGECTDCIQARCWRYTECHCRCHFSPPEEDDNEEDLMFPSHP
jgi:hypothetical protein